MGVITVSAVCFVRDDGAVLTVRKLGTSAYMLPGGKPEAGETAAECAAREVHEELGIVIDPLALQPFGEWNAKAANEPGFTVHATVFMCPASSCRELAKHDEALSRAVQAEIDDARWIDPAIGMSDANEAPLNREYVFPLLLAS